MHPFPKPDWVEPYFPEYRLLNGKRQWGIPLASEGLAELCRDQVQAKYPLLKFTVTSGTGLVWYVVEAR